ncbi:mRNA splicing factor snRNP Sm-D (nucleomorph) [Bigelowiella natans]|uniref:mRNA splicing factor snRNP Sm-D n=1 Tax=Bigelowiella natans TaxID=227086 RepID=Q3LWH6_BIGNA|nr:mRNA splicing factor snRNP Sm-D [Bigelowiella natans]ABA27190.1 mRNA splicing factor snRNP Sm-D [Bigelowiella natans]
MSVLYKDFEKLKNESLKIVLKSHTTIIGTLQDSDILGNIVLKFAKVSQKNKNEMIYKDLIIRGNSVRYIILPVNFGF